MPPNSAVCETNASATEERSLEMNRQYRQGDVLLCAVEQIPRDARPVMPKSGRVVVAGELTRHAHDFDAEDVQLFWQKRRCGRSFLRIAADAELQHEEHASRSSCRPCRARTRCTRAACPRL
jgi:hypothetical protein